MVQEYKSKKVLMFCLNMEVYRVNAANITRANPVS
jgi:hypothetical protein